MIAERTGSAEPGSTFASLPTPRRAILSSPRSSGSSFPSAGCLVIHDLGCGTGSMGRWLAPAPAGAAALGFARPTDPLDAVRPPSLPARRPDGASVPRRETLASDVTQLHPGDLVDASLVTASALLDLLTRDEAVG
jgi:hypothetical protein